MTEFHYGDDTYKPTKEGGYKMREGIEYEIEALPNGTFKVSRPYRGIGYDYPMKFLFLLGSFLGT
jgi:hypothetical protein